MRFDTLYHKGKGGKLYEWTIWTEGDTILTEHGIVDGKMQTSEKKAEAKNVGKSNQTTPEEQAQNEAVSIHKKKLDLKYATSPEEAEQTVFLPMLAQCFEKRKKKLKYPVDAQPKLDGVRCLASWEDEEVVLTSRGGKRYNLSLIHI